MISDINMLDLEKQYSYAEYLTWKFDEYVELIKGKIFRMTPGPSALHQQISSNLLEFFLVARHITKCQVFHAPFDVRLFPNKDDSKNLTVVQPDICVVCDSNKIDRQGCNGAPELIIEILSPSTSKKDIQEKYALYQEAGVNEYWIVIPEIKVVEVFELIGEKYQLKKQYVEDDIISVSIFNGMYLDLKSVFPE